MGNKICPGALAIEFGLYMARLNSDDMISVVRERAFQEQECNGNPSTQIDWTALNTEAYGTLKTRKLAA